MDLTNLPELLSSSDSLTVAAASAISARQVLLLILAVAGLTAVMFSTRRRIRESKALSGGSVRRRYAELRQQRGAARDLEQVMLELDQLSRQIHGRLDTKLARLEAVMRDADQRIAQLAQLVPKVPGGDTTATVKKQAHHRDGLRPAGTGKPQPGGERHADIYRLADRGLSAAAIAREVEQTIGEIELILALRRTRSQAGVPHP